MRSFAKNLLSLLVLNDAHRESGIVTHLPGLKFPARGFFGIEDARTRRNRRDER